MADHIDTEAGEGGRQMFRLVDNSTPAKDTKAAGGHQHAPGSGHGGGGCGCGGHGGGGGRGHGGGQGGGGCGCGGHGGGGRGRRHAAQQAQGATAAASALDAFAPASASGATAAASASGQASSAAPVAASSSMNSMAQPTADDELVIHSIPKVVRHPVLFAAADAIPVGQSIVINAPHQPQPLFDHLGESENRYRVETLEAGPEAWRYRVTRVG